MQKVKNTLRECCALWVLGIGAEGWYLPFFRFESDWGGKKWKGKIGRGVTRASLTQKDEATGTVVHSKEGGEGATQCKRARGANGNRKG